MKDLGIINSWKKTPKEFLRCNEKNCKVTVKYLNESGTYKEFHCPNCKIKWRVDSSD